MNASEQRPIYAFGKFRLDAQRRVLSREDGEPVPLAPKAFDTLLHLVERRGELFEKRALLAAVWPSTVVEENNLSQCISMLRRALGEKAGEHRFIVTEPGRGYRFVAPVAELERPAPTDAAPGPLSVDSPAERRARITPVRLAWAAAIALAFVAVSLVWTQRPDSALPDGGSARIEARPTASVDAYRAYWQAFEARDRGDRRRALDLLEEAVRLDPQFAAAYGHLALLSARSLVDWGMREAVPTDPRMIERQVLENARKALELDPTSALAHVARAKLNMFLWRWDEARREFAEAYRLSPNDPDVVVFYLEFETFRGAYDAALPLAQRCVELDPPKPDPEAVGTGSLYCLWLVHTYSGNSGGAVRPLEEHLALHPRQAAAWLNLGFVEARRGHLAGAERAFRHVEELTADGRSRTFAANLAHGYARIGRSDDALRLFREIESKARGPTPAGTSAMAHLAIGERETAVAWLETAIEKIENHEPDAGWFSLMILKHNLTADPVLDEPPFRELRARIRGID